MRDARRLIAAATTIPLAPIASRAMVPPGAMVTANGMQGIPVHACRGHVARL